MILSPNITLTREPDGGATFVSTPSYTSPMELTLDAKAVAKLRSTLNKWAEGEANV